MSEDKDNLALWESLATPPEEALKPIKGGRLRGMTDISPMWRWKKLTETFGMCGEGWGFDINYTETETYPSGEATFTVQGTGWVSIMNVTGIPQRHTFPGMGCAAIVAKESGGLYTDDEAPKKALTDAMGMAFKHIGLAADIYWEKGSTKYQTEQKVNEERQKENQERATLTDKARGLYKSAKDAGEDADALVTEYWPSAKSAKDITSQTLESLRSGLTKWMADQEEKKA